MMTLALAVGLGSMALLAIYLAVRLVVMLCQGLTYLWERFWGERVNVLYFSRLGGEYGWHAESLSSGIAGVVHYQNGKWTAFRHHHPERHTGRTRNAAVQRAIRAAEDARWLPTGRT